MGIDLSLKQVYDINRVEAIFDLTYHHPIIPHATNVLTFIYRTLPLITHRANFVLL